MGETGCDSLERVFFGRGMITGWSEASTELRSGDLVHDVVDDDGDDSSAAGMGGTGGTIEMGGVFLGIVGVS